MTTMTNPETTARPWQYAEKIEGIIRRIESGSQWQPQPESTGHLRRWLLDSLQTLALSLRRHTDNKAEPPDQISTPRVLLDQLADHLGNLGDETSQILEMRIHVLTGRLGIGAVLREPTPPPPRTIWACYIGIPAHSLNGIEVHESYRACLEAVAEALEVPFNDPDDPQQVRDDDELAEAVGQVSSDWCIEELTIPEAPK